MRNLKMRALTLEAWWHLRFLQSRPILLLSPRRRRIHHEVQLLTAEPGYTQRALERIALKAALNRDLPDEATLLRRIFDDDPPVHTTTHDPRLLLGRPLGATPAPAAPRQESGCEAEPDGRKHLRNDPDDFRRAVFCSHSPRPWRSWLRARILRRTKEGEEASTDSTPRRSGHARGRAKERTMYGTGFLPTEESDLYSEDGAGRTHASSSPDATTPPRQDY